MSGSVRSPVATTFEHVGRSVRSDLQSHLGNQICFVISILPADDAAYLFTDRQRKEVLHDGAVAVMEIRSHIPLVVMWIVF